MLPEFLPPPLQSCLVFSTVFNFSTSYVDFTPNLSLFSYWPYCIWISIAADVSFALFPENVRPRFVAVKTGNIPYCTAFICKCSKSWLLDLAEMRHCHRTTHCQTGWLSNILLFCYVGLKMATAVLDTWLLLLLFEQNVTASYAFCFMLDIGLHIGQIHFSKLLSLKQFIFIHSFIWFWFNIRCPSCILQLSKLSNSTALTGNDDPLWSTDQQPPICISRAGYLSNLSWYQCSHSIWFAILVIFRWLDYIVYYLEP